MSNLRIKNKKYKEELKFIREIMLSQSVDRNEPKAIELRYGLMLTDEDERDHIEECFDQVKNGLIEGIKDYIEIEYNCEKDNNFPHFHTLTAKISIVSGNEKSEEV